MTDMRHVALTDMRETSCPTMRHVALTDMRETSCTTMRHVALTDMGHVMPNNETDMGHVALTDMGHVALTAPNNETCLPHCACCARGMHAFGFLCAYMHDENGPGQTCRAAAFGRVSQSALEHNWREIGLELRQRYFVSDNSRRLTSQNRKTQ